MAPKNTPVILQRKAHSEIQRLLFIKAGGRCEFDGCNKYLLRHHLTKESGNFADIAHIVAFSKDGPRGNYTSRPKDIHEVRNLMLLCPSCHKLIDKYPGRYSVITLKEYKYRHERRIYLVTGLESDKTTAIVQLKANIGGDAVDLPIPQIIEAIAPRYPVEVPGYLIDLTAIEGGSAAFYEMAKQEISQRVRRLYEHGSDIKKAQHISLFALAPIPLLIFLGSCLSNKIPVDPYQRHRKSEKWSWMRKGKPVEYKFKVIRKGRNKNEVALVLSLSGTISFDDLPSKIRSDFNIYEIRLTGQMPNPDYLNLREDLDRFGVIYRESLRRIQYEHGNLADLHLFPAVPAPVAVLCGKELFPKVDPDLIVYDYEKSRGGFSPILKIGRSPES